MFETFASTYSATLACTHYNIIYLLFTIFLYFNISIIIINIGTANIIPKTLNKRPNNIIEIIHKVSGNLLVSLYILGVITYASILGSNIDTIDVNINNFLLITDAVVIASTLVSNEPIYGIKVLIELSNPNNK